jgi:O-antigen ligase
MMAEAGFGAFGGMKLHLGWNLGRFDEAERRRFSDIMAAAVAASLPWSTSATGILIVVWLISLAGILKPADIRAELRTPAGALPVAFWALAGLSLLWSDASWFDRFEGFNPYHKLLAIPLLLAQFRRSANALWVAGAFLAASAVLMVVSWALVLLPGLTWRGKIPAPGNPVMLGVPVKDYISQAGMFTLCAAALLWAIADNWGHRRARWLGLGLIAAFIGNCVYVATSRTALIVIPVLFALFALRRCTIRQIAGIAAIGIVLSGAVWASSPYLRNRVESVRVEIASYMSSPASGPTSAGERLEFWRKSLTFMAQAPLIGHGTGTVKQLFDASNVGQTDVFAAITANPHNQTLMTGIELGVVGIVFLYLMWGSHLLLFRNASLIGWIGLAVVVQNFVSSLVNSHLLDFTQGWLYVFGVGVMGGAMQASRRRGEGTAPPVSPN